MTNEPKLTLKHSELLGALVSGMIIGAYVAYLLPARKAASYSQHVGPNAIEVFLMVDSPLRFIIAPVVVGLMSVILFFILFVAVPKILPTVVNAFLVFHAAHILIAIAVVSVILAAVCILYERSPEYELSGLLEPHGGRLITGRRAYRDQMQIYFPAQMLTDEFLPEIVEIVIKAKEQRRWMSQQPYWKSIEFSLSNSPVTDAGLRHLESLPERISVSLRNTKVTAEGVRRLEKQRPDLWIGWKAGDRVNQDPQKADDRLPVCNPD